jgi:hypothetical protein
LWKGYRAGHRGRRSVEVNSRVNRVEMSFYLGLEQLVATDILETS